MTQAYETRKACKAQMYEEIQDTKRHEAMGRMKAGKALHLPNCYSNKFSSCVSGPKYTPC